MAGSLFNKIYIQDHVHNYRKKLAFEVDSIEITDSTNIDLTVQQLKQKYTINPLFLKEPIPSKPVESTIDREAYNQTYIQKVFEIKVVIPFEGDIELFDCYPSESKMINFDNNVYINNSSITTTIVLEHLDAEKYQNMITKLISQLSSDIPTINTEISPWNNMLEPHIKQLIESRKEVVAKKFDFMEKIGLRINTKSDDFIPSPITRKIIPKPVSETSHNIKRELIPTLQEDVYRDIKEVLYNVGKAIERKPALYLNKYEEDIRDIFLLFLETRYDSTSGVGEAFNKSGRTDILLKFSKDGSNLFVAECKFWKGQKKLFEAIDQLLGYLTHRDSKTALMFFVDQKDPYLVKETLKTEIANHVNYKRYVKDNYDTSLEYEFSLPSDSKKIIQVEVMLFHFPK